jgi:hypothetical protein
MLPKVGTAYELTLTGTVFQLLRALRQRPLAAPVWCERLICFG